MAAEPKSGPIKRGFYQRFSQWLGWHQEGDETPALADRLRQHYPADADEIIKFMENVLKRRDAIVDKLAPYPELNDHGFFMVMCRMYIDTHRGVGYSSSRIQGMIELFATSEISLSTASRRLQKANEIGIFVTDKDIKDNRRQRYYLSEEMIRLFSETFGGMIDDVIAAHPKQTSPRE